MTAQVAAQVERIFASRPLGERQRDLGTYSPEPETYRLNRHPRLDRGSISRPFGLTQQQEMDSRFRGDET